MFSGSPLVPMPVAASIRRSGPTSRGVAPTSATPPAEVTMISPVPLIVIAPLFSATLPVLVVMLIAPPALVMLGSVYVTPAPSTSCREKQSMVIVPLVL